MSSRTVARSKRVQYAALPYRPTGSSGTEVMLVTSRGRQRWIIPKGWPHSGRAPATRLPAKLLKKRGYSDWLEGAPWGYFGTKSGSRKGASQFVTCMSSPCMSPVKGRNGQKRINEKSNGSQSKRLPKRCRMLASGRSYVAGRGRLPLLDGGFGLQPLRGRGLDTVDQSGLCSRERGNDFR